MKNFSALVLITLVFLAGCRKVEESGERADEHAAARAQAAAAQAENIVDVEPSKLRDLRITTATVEQRPGGEAVKILAQITPNQNAYAEVGSPIAARVIRVRAAPGQFVRRGQGLAELQSSELGKARAEYHSAEARLELARKTLERKRSLGVDRIVPRREIQEAESDLAAANAHLSAARALLQALGVAAVSSADASRFVLQAPISGTILDRSISLGQTVDASKPLFWISDLSRVWLVGHAFERDAIRMKPGTQATVTLAALPGRTFRGGVTHVGIQVDASSRTIPIRIELDNSERLFRPGMSANASVPVSTSGTSILTVPVASLQRVRDTWVVFIPRGTGSFEIRNVGRGRDLEGEVEIVSGLRPGESVVVDGAFLLKAEAEKSAGEGGHHDH